MSKLCCDARKLDALAECERHVRSYRAVVEISAQATGASHIGTVRGPGRLRVVACVREAKLDVSRDKHPERTVKVRRGRSSRQNE